MKSLSLAALTAILAIGATNANAHSHDYDSVRDAHIDYYFDVVDTDDNGTITEAENAAFANRMFHEADTDNNLLLTRDELHYFKVNEFKRYRYDINTNPDPRVYNKKKGDGRIQ